MAVGSDGTIYVGVAEPQAVLAVDPKSGVVKQRLVLDSAEIASTKELVTLRTNPDRTRLYIANGSDESATILRLPDLAVLREITMEGETIRDVIPDPRGRYVYILGRRVHVYDAEGGTELRTLPIEDPWPSPPAPTARCWRCWPRKISAARKRPSVALFDTTTFAEVARDPMQTEKTVEAAMFAAGDRSIIAFSRDSMFEKRVTSRPTRITRSGTAERRHARRHRRSREQHARLSSRRQRPADRDAGRQRRPARLRRAPLQRQRHLFRLEPRA